MIARIYLVVLLALTSIPARASESPEKLCEVLGRVGAGDQIPATLTGVYIVSYENELLYDPETPACPLDVQPATYLEFSPDFGADRRFEEQVRYQGRVWATFTGVLWGPGDVKADDLSAPTMIAYAERIANRRYGHMNAFRTRFIVRSVRDVRPVPKETPSYGAWAEPRTTGVPRLTSGDLPRYPPAAQNVGISGPVVVEVTVADGAVKAMNVRSGDRILSDAVLANIATWRFEPGVQATFRTTFLFELRRARTGANPNVEMELNLPILARLTASMNGW
jgi:TonB family protein